MCLCCSKGGVADLAEWCDCGSAGEEEGSYLSAVSKGAGKWEELVVACCFLKQ